MSNDEYKNYPYFDEEIKINAIKCKKCQSIYYKDEGLANNKAQDKPEHEQLIGMDIDKTTDTGSTLTKTGTSLMALGCILTLLVTIPILFILFLVGC